MYGLPFTQPGRNQLTEPGFLSSSWHVTSRGMFAGSCIGVICLVIVLEFLRRVAREYDAFIVHRAQMKAQYLSSPHPGPRGLRVAVFR